MSRSNRVLFVEVGITPSCPVAPDQFFWLAGGVFVAGLFYPGYSHRSMFISVLGATGSVHGVWVNWVVFAGAEVWVLLFLVFAGRRFCGNTLSQTGLFLVGLYAVLLLTAAFHPCDFACRSEDPYRTHLIHISASLLAYAAGFLLAAMLQAQALAGLFQRLLEGLIYLWMTGLGVLLPVARTRSGSV